jgi:hypothetical protein
MRENFFAKSCNMPERAVRVCDLEFAKTYGKMIELSVTKDSQLDHSLL